MRGSLKKLYAVMTQLRSNLYDSFRSFRRSGIYARHNVLLSCRA
ncbi:hypothetical protein [Wielerella bovis]|nr:hypothetical protein [Wielerella bovis]